MSATTTPVAETKQAMDKEAAEQLSAFDYGIDVFCADHGLDKTAFARELGVERVEDLAEGASKWLQTQLKASEGAKA